MAFESVVVSEDWSSNVIVPLYNGKGERADFINYGGITYMQGS